ncbi:MAG TPA: hypothetical protein PK360_03970 [bacterium]|nr:hypothetical protein [bacterium]
MRLFFRYRRPSLNTLLGITRAKRRLKKATGYYALTKPLRLQTNWERRLKRKAGYYHPVVRFLRYLFGWKI